MLLPVQRERLKAALVHSSCLRDAETRITAKDGRRLNVIAAADILEVNDQKYLLTVMLNITSRKQAEEKLAISEERWSSALECSGEGVWDWDLANQRMYYSREWKTMLGYEEDEIRNDSQEWRARVHPDDYESIWAKAEQHMCGLTAIYQSEYRLKTKDGSYKWILDRGKVTSRDEEGNPRGLSGLIPTFPVLRRGRRS
jgi:PAS domain S-box-containing protein